MVLANEQGFSKVIAFVYAMNPELRLFAFPQPRLRMMIDTLAMRAMRSWTAWTATVWLLTVVF